MNLPYLPFLKAAVANEFDTYIHTYIAGALQMQRPVMSIAATAPTWPARITLAGPMFWDTCPIAYSKTTYTYIHTYIDYIYIHTHGHMFFYLSAVRCHTLCLRCYASKRLSTW